MRGGMGVLGGGAGGHSSSVGVESGNCTPAHHTPAEGEERQSLGPHCVCVCACVREYKFMCVSACGSVCVCMYVIILMYVC